MDRIKANDWMDQAASGNDAAFGWLAEGLQDDLYRFCLAQSLYPSDAAEAVQEALMRAYRSRNKWRPGGEAVGWLMGFALNVCREMRRQRRHQPRGLDETVVQVAATMIDPPPSDGELDVRQLAEAIEKLPARQREAVICRYLRRMTIEQTAATMNCRGGTVKAAVFAGLANLRKLMQRPI